jgi:predicted HicB family RNase H-like nuclease
MDRFTYKGYKALFERLEDNTILGRIVGIPDTITFHVERIEDAVKAFHEAVDEFLEDCAEMGRTPPVPLDVDNKYTIFTANGDCNVDPT